MLELIPNAQPGIRQLLADAKKIANYRIGDSILNDFLDTDIFPLDLSSYT